uniref:Uncharacterized protein n=1 Tax=Erythrolobus madagascarensis TaxID=708628 RepID=A0A7S0T6C3_9RHOD
MEKRMVCGLEDATIAEIDRVLVGLRAGKKKEERLKIRILRSNLRSSVTRGVLRSDDEFLKLVELVRRDPVAVAIVMGRDGGKRHRALEKLKKVDSVGEAVDQFISSKHVSALLYEITRALSEAPSTEARSAHTAELVTTATTIDSAPSKRERKKRRASSAGEAAVIPNENGKSVLKLSTILTQILTSILK